MNETHGRIINEENKQQSLEELIEKGRVLHSQAIFLALASAAVSIINMLLRTCHLDKYHLTQKYAQQPLST